MDERHDDGCRCTACCKRKMDSAPHEAWDRVPPQRHCNHFLFEVRVTVERPK